MQGVRKMNQKTFKIIYLEMCMVETLVSSSINTIQGSHVDQEAIFLQLSDRPKQ